MEFRRVQLVAAIFVGSAAISSVAHAELKNDLSRCFKWVEEINRANKALLTQVNSLENIRLVIEKLDTATEGYTQIVDEYNSRLLNYSGQVEEIKRETRKYQKACTS